MKQDAPPREGLEGLTKPSDKNDSLVLKDEDATPTLTPASESAPAAHKTTSAMTVMIGGMAIFSDGYNAQMIGYMNPVLSRLYPNEYDSSMQSRMSSAFLVGEVFGMLLFGWTIDRLGRRTGILGATVCLVLGIILTTAAHGTTINGQFWMMIIGRAIAGVGAGGKQNLLPRCGERRREHKKKTCSN